MRGRRRDDVEQGALHDVGVACVALREQEAPRDHDRPDRRARLRVGAVRRQHEVVAERLVLVVRPLPAGDVGARGLRALPLPRDRGDELVVPGLHGHVDGPRGEVVRAHRVAPEHRGLAHRDVVLVVRAAPLDVRERAAPTALDEERRLAHVARLVERAPELRERHLDLRVPAHALDAVGPERLAHVVGGAPRDLDEEVVGVAGAHARDGRLQEVALHVELVAPLEVRVPGGLAGWPNRVHRYPSGACAAATRSTIAAKRRSRASSGRRPSSQAIASSSLYTSESLNSRPRRVVATSPRTTASKLPSQPSASSQCSMCASVAVRLTSWRSPQNPPVMRTCASPSGCSRPVAGTTGRPPSVGRAPVPVVRGTVGVVVMAAPPEATGSPRRSSGTTPDGVGSVGRGARSRSGTCVVVIPSAPRT